MNGLGITSKKWVEALERATLRTDLRFLTLLPFEGALSCVAAFRCTRAWCPACYEDWRCAGDVIYEPLLRAIEPVTVCRDIGNVWRKLHEYGGITATASWYRWLRNWDCQS